MNRYVSVPVFAAVMLWGCAAESDSGSMSLSASSLEFDSRPCEKSVFISSDVPWGEASVLPAWLDVDYLPGDGMSTEAVFSVSENVSEQERCCVAVFAAGDIRREIAVRQRGREHLRVKGGRRMTVSCLPSAVSVELDCNVNYQVEIPDSSGSWISRRKTGLADMLDNRTAGIVYGGLRLDVAYNESESERTAAVVVFNSECGVSDTLHIVQTGNPGFYADGQSVCIQKSDDGGANIVLMGDGFTLEGLSVGGRYDSIMRQAAQYFFSIEPYASYRHFFNVYMVAAVSMQSGVGVRGVKQVDNKFGTQFGSGTSISCNDDLCLEYARKVPGLDVQSPVLVIVVLNSTEYYGTTYMYADGNAIALCPMSARPSPDDFKGLIHHEAGGHGFGFLCDEYVYYYNMQMPENRKSELRRWQDRGFYGNLDFTDDLSSIAWSCFIGMDKYRQVGAFEGGYEYGKGVWRPEENSCMNDNVPYYNAQSRYLIVNRIMTLSGRYCSVYDFMETDCAADVPVCTRGGAERDFEPLGAPVLKYVP